MKYLLSIIIISLTLGSDFFKYATMYTSYSLATPNQPKDTNAKQEDNYSLTFGIRKIGRYAYQAKQGYYDGTEENITDNAFMGSVNGWEYLINHSEVQLNELEFADTKFWIRNTKDHFVYKFKYYKIDSRNLEFYQGDMRYRLNYNNLDITVGMALLGHSAYGYDAYSEYNDFWWNLAFDYGYEDFMIPATDLNNNGIIDDPYYVWIETNPYTLDGYWIYFDEGVNYYWEDENGNYVAGSDAEFEQYHLPDIIMQYNEDQIDALGSQNSASLVIGLDYFCGKEKFYFHTWTSIMPFSKALTDYAFVDETKYEVGLLLGYNIGNIGLFIESNYLNMFKDQYTFTTGINYQFK